jgi:HD superfamily phosphohydrolase
MERNYRDAVHNIIRLDAGTADGRLIAALIDTPEFQRLRRVRQLGLAFFAYQTAEHSRFTHSLGAFFLATRLLDRLAAKYEIADKDRAAVRAAALLHDLGHGPFSHVMETILGFHHEALTIEAVTSPETAVGRVLADYSAALPNDVADIVRGRFRRRALGQLVSSQLDVDRMDYLLRDSLMTGVKYGIFDLEWVLKSIEIDTERDRLYVSPRGLYAVEDYLQARYYMFRQVYFHRTLRSAEVVLRSILARAVRLCREGKEVWLAKGTPLESVFGGGKLALADHLCLDDNDVLFHIKQWRNSDDAILSDLASRFLDRRIFKAFDLDMPDAERAHFVAAAREAVERSGFDPEYYFFEDVAGNEPYFFYSGEHAEDKDRIFVETGFSRPEIKEISEISPAIRGLQRGQPIRRICFPAEARDAISALYHRS